MRNQKIIAASSPRTTKERESSLSSLVDKERKSRMNNFTLISVWFLRHNVIMSNWLENHCHHDLEKVLLFEKF